MSLQSLSKAFPSWADCKRLDDYYDGKTRLMALGVSIPPEVRVLEMIAPWPRMSVDVLAELLTFVGYTMGEEQDDPRLDVLKRVYQINNMDTIIRTVLTEALVQGVGYLLVGPGDGVPRISVVAKKDVALTYDFMGRPDEALVRWYAAEGEERWAHYQVGVTEIYDPTGPGDPKRLETIRSIDGRIALIPIVNRVRADDVNGRSEMLDVLKLADAGSRTLTNIQVAQELEAMPKRWIFADGIAEAFQQSRKDKLEAYMGYLNFGPEGGTVQQLSGAALDPIANNYKLYAQIVSSLYGIPPSMLGISTDNPASAESMRVAKERLTSRGEVKQSMFGDALEELARVVLEVAGESVDGLETLETVWRDVATPSKSSQQSMALQAFQAGAISAKTMRDFLDLTPSQRQYEDTREMSQTGLAQRTVSRAAIGTDELATGDSALVQAASNAGDAGGPGEG